MNFPSRKFGQRGGGGTEIENRTSGFPPSRFVAKCGRDALRSLALPGAPSPRGAAPARERTPDQPRGDGRLSLAGLRRKPPKPIALSEGRGVRDGGGTQPGGARRSKQVAPAAARLRAFPPGPGGIS